MAEEKNRQMIQYHFFATKEQAEQIEKEEPPDDSVPFLCNEGTGRTDRKEMVRLLRIYGNNLNQLARRANEGGSIYRDDVEDLKREMHELWKMMRQILERLSHLD